MLLRLYGVRQPKTHAAVEAWLWQAAETLVSSAADPRDHNQAMMELGALLCRTRKPRCTACPVRRWCVARRAGTQGDIPQRTAPKPRPHHTVVVGVITRPGPQGREEILIQRRPLEGLLGGLWELPGGRQEPGETLEATLGRELDEELGVPVEVGPEILSLDHAYSHFSITLHVFRCTLDPDRGADSACGPVDGPVDGRPVPLPRTLVARELRWVPIGHLGDFAFPRANGRVLRHLLGQETTP